MPSAKMSGIAATLYMGNMMHTKLGVRGVFGRGRAFQGLNTDPSALKGRVVLVTGGTGGIGRAAAAQLARMGAEVHIVGRNEQKGNAAIEEMNRELKDAAPDVQFHRVDLSKLSSTRDFARRFASEVLGEDRSLDVLINNAAVMPPAHSLADENGGHEMALSTNLLSWYILSNHLAPRITAKDGKIITVVSAGMKLFKLHPDELRSLDEAEGKAYDGVKSYSITHRARVLLTKRWAQQKPGLTTATVHPGWVDTPGLSSAKQMRGFYKTMKGMLRTEDEGADTIVWLAASPNEKISSGKYYRDRKVRGIDFALAGTSATEKEVDALESMVKELTSSYLPEAKL